MDRLFLHIFTPLLWKFFSDLYLRNTYYRLVYVWRLEDICVNTISDHLALSAWLTKDWFLCISTA